MILCWLMFYHQYQNATSKFKNLPFDSTEFCFWFYWNSEGSFERQQALAYLVVLQIIYDGSQQTEPSPMLLVETFRIDSSQINGCTVKMLRQKVFHLLKHRCILTRTARQCHPAQGEKNCTNEHTSMQSDSFTIMFTCLSIILCCKSMDK